MNQVNQTPSKKKKIKFRDNKLKKEDSKKQDKAHKK